MIKQIKKLCNETNIVFLPNRCSKYYDVLQCTLKNVILLKETKNCNDIIKNINNTKIKKIYLFDYDDFYRLIIPKIKKDIKICWIFQNSFSSMSNLKVRNNLNTIFEYYDRDLISSIGCLNISNKIVLENAGYRCEYIDLTMKKERKNISESNSIGILSDDYDPNNNFYNQLASITLVDYSKCKFINNIKVTKDFYKYFNINSEIQNSIDEVMKDNFVNLYINFTNTNKELIFKSYNSGVPVIVGNTDFYEKNEFLKNHLVVKSDDDINEIADKIKYVKKNYNKIMEEYLKM